MRQFRSARNGGTFETGERLPAREIELSEAMDSDFEKPNFFMSQK